MGKPLPRRHSPLGKNSFSLFVTAILFFQSLQTNSDSHDLKEKQNPNDPAWDQGSQEPALEPGLGWEIEGDWLVVRSSFLGPSQAQPKEVTWACLSAGGPAVRAPASEAVCRDSGRYKSCTCHF